MWLVFSNKNEYPPGGPDLTTLVPPPASNRIRAIRNFLLFNSNTDISITAKFFIGTDITDSVQIANVELRPLCTWIYDNLLILDPTRSLLFLVDNAGAHLLANVYEENVI